MQNIDALYFPDTSIETRRVYQELLLFNHLYFYQVAEEPNLAADNDQEGLCTGYPPLPMGEEIDRFNHLLRELKGHEQEFYSGQLSGMALGKAGYRDENTVRDIISSVARGEHPKKGQTDRDTLWHYRLLLKLAEMKRREEEELDRELAEVSEKEASLYDYLKGDPELDRIISGAAPAQPGGISEMNDTLLKAWGHLFLHDDRHNHSILLTANKDAAESLLEAHNALSGGRLPVRICRLALPLLDGMENDAWLALRSNFRQKAKKVLNGFSELFSRIAAAGKTEDTLAKSTLLAAEWGSLVEELPPLDEHLTAVSGNRKYPSPPHLEIYLSEYSLAALVARHCRLTPLADYADNSFGLIALKTSRPITCTA